MIRPAPRVSGPKSPRPPRALPHQRAKSPRPQGEPPRRETELVRAILDYLARCPGVVAWRMNVGMAMLPGRGGQLQPVRFGVRGMADVIGWVDHCRYPAGEPIDTHSNPIPCVGRGMYHVPRFLALEVKRPGRPLRPEQAAFLEQVHQAGGLAARVESVDDVRRVLGR